MKDHSKGALFDTMKSRTFTAMPVLPPRGEDQKTKPVTITLPRWLSDRVDQLAGVLGYRGRSELISRALEGALPELEALAEKAEGAAPTARERKRR
ncbi:CopG family ribbon-helix-helix protein [Corallococcus aberystwythensis]|uniref:Ribbon-helix-helix protein, CopG family n=1 Tax=Corallococcus aberystwythensis TaxID=2316722 RepID=A0A3A8Q614_9BACT|nr:ribbon-helix-helix protein, CopG family [Corallococcus aberystwythensis]